MPKTFGGYRKRVRAKYEMAGGVSIPPRIRMARAVSGRAHGPKSVQIRAPCMIIRVVLGAGPF